MKNNNLLKKLVSFLLVFIMLIQSTALKSSADDTLKLELSILTDLKPESEAKLVYWSGEGINPFADFSISGTGVSIENPKTVITVPKVKVGNNVVINQTNIC